MQHYQILPVFYVKVQLEEDKHFWKRGSVLTVRTLVAQQEKRKK